MGTAAKIAILGTTIVLACVWGPAPADAARKARGCAAGRFVVTQGQDMLGGGAPPPVLVVDGGTLSVEGACPAAGKARKRRKGTSLSARLARCGALRNVRLRAMARDCATVQGTLRARKQHATLAAAASTCGDGMVDAGNGEQCDVGQGCGEGATCTSDCRCAPGTGQLLECDALGYPCSWTDVPAPILQRSIELANQAGAILDGGGTTAEAAQAIEGDDPAELQYDLRVVRFRLEGGRPVWLAKPGSLDPDPEVVPAPATLASASALAPAAPRPNLVVSAGQPAKSAYVIDPFAFSDDGRGPLMAGLIGGIRGYEGNVTYLANASADDYTVAAHEFTRFGGHNVVHVLSHGATICEDIRTAAPTPCRGIIAVHQVSTAGEVSLEIAGDRGLDFLRYSDHEWWIVATADFFRYHYPAGLHDALVIFDACESDGTDMAGALEGPRSNYVGWDANASVKGAPIVMQEFLLAMGQGRAIQEVWNSMGPHIKDPVGGRARLIIGPQNIRIRELPRLVDPATGAPVTSDSTVQVEKHTEDGEPDAIFLDVEFDGIGPTEGGGYTVHVSIDGWEFVNGPLIDFAAPLTDYRWKGGGKFELGYDLAEGQPLNVVVTINLPEGGSSTFAASPKATGPQWSPGTKWHGTFTKITDIGVATVTLVVEATFERDPNQPPTTQPTFHQTGGAMVWSLLDAPGDSCTRTLADFSMTLGKDVSNTLTFDLTKKPVEYRGFASTTGSSVEVVVSCPWGDSVTHMTAGGTWFVATSDDHFTVDGDTILADFTPNAVSHHSWSASKVY